MRPVIAVLVLVTALAVSEKGHASTFVPQYNDLGRSGCFGSSYLPMGSALALGTFYDPMVNCFPGLTMDPWMMSGGADGRYYSGYPWAPRDPSFPLSGNSPYYYHSRRYSDDEPSSSSSYPFSYHSYFSSRSSPSSSSRASGSGKGNSEPGAEPAGEDDGFQDAPLVIEPVTAGDQSLVFPAQGGALPQALHASPARAAQAAASRAADFDGASLVADAGKSDGSVQRPILGHTYVKGKPVFAAPEPDKTKAADKPSPAPAAAVGGKRPAPPISLVTGELQVQGLMAAPVSRPAPSRAPAPAGDVAPAPAVDVARQAGAGPLPPTAGQPSAPAALSSTEVGPSAIANNVKAHVKPDEATSGAEACLGCKSVGTPEIPNSQLYENLITSVTNGSPAVAGARKLMATLYQSCDSISKTLPVGYRMKGSRQPPDGVRSDRENPNVYFFSPAEAVKSHYFIDSSYDGRKCRDMRKVLPVFHVGGKPSIRYKDGALSVDPFDIRMSGGNLTSMDCSGFISGAMASAGLKMRKSPDPRGAYQMGTSAMINLGKSDEDCMKPARFDKEQTVRPGDVMVLRQPNKSDIYGHAMMFESAGPDPFALSGIGSRAECNDKNINWNKWDFRVIHSAGMAGRMAVTRMTAQNLVVEQSQLKNWIMELAIRACHAKFSPSATEAVVNFPLKGGRMHRGISVIRHVGPAVAACVEDKPVRLVGEDCVKDCPGVNK